MSPASPVLARLLQLASPALPVGAFSYSQGLESAVEARLVVDARSATTWIGDVLELSIARMDAPLLLRLHVAWQERDFVAVARWNDVFLATREASELRAETVQMGFSLRRLLGDLDLGTPSSREALQAMPEVAFPVAFAHAAVGWAVPASDMVVGYLWGWLENQTLAAVKAVPLGQTEAQRMLAELASRLPRIAAESEGCTDEALGNFTPRLAILASQHETQYSRLFRS
jgi:urease accessory protein